MSCGAIFRCKKNKKTLQKRGVQVIDPEFGEQACGEIGFGRMPEPLAIVDFLFNLSY